VRKSIIIIIAFALAVSSGAWAQGLGKGSYRHFGGRTGAGKKNRQCNIGHTWAILGMTYWKIEKS
jgi:hypothetical protein